MIGLLLAVIYLSFVSLGLPDSVLGSAWPVMSEDFSVSISSMGIVTMIISGGTIFSGFISAKLIEKLGPHKITFFSVVLTAVALFGFSISPSFIVVCLFAIPYGLGAGCVDAALNNYVALNFESKHMSWLHCMWGVGATIGPYIMGMALTNNMSFRGGYMILFGLQAILGLIILSSAPLWKSKNLSTGGFEEQRYKSLSIKEIFAIKGVKPMFITFLCYCGLEQTTGFWASSYLVYDRNLEPEIAAGFTALFYLGITIGRGINGFIAMKFTDKQMIRGGSAIMALGVLILFLPFEGAVSAYIGISLIGLGSAPIYPCIVHSTPFNFGAENSQSIIGVQMSIAYVGILLMPPLFGLIGNSLSFSLYPVYLGLAVLTMIFMYEFSQKALKKNMKNL